MSLPVDSDTKFRTVVLFCLIWLIVTTPASSQNAAGERRKSCIFLPACFAGDNEYNIVKQSMRNKCVCGLYDEGTKENRAFI